MNNKRQNQLIGFITLLLFVLVFFPYIITDKSKQVESTIPLLSSVGLETDNKIFVNEEKINNFNNFSADNNEDVAHYDELNVTQHDNSFNGITNSDDSNQAMDKDFLIQLVALKNKRKIEELVALLKLNNYDVYIDPKVPVNGEVIRLFVGYYPTKEQAELVIIDLENLTKLKGFVVTR